MISQPVPDLAGLLQQLRAQAGLTQEELAEAAGLSPRTVSDLERGIHRSARPNTVRLLADALELAEPLRGLFVARGQLSTAQALPAHQSAAHCGEQAHSHWQNALEISADLDIRAGHGANVH